MPRREDVGLALIDFNGFFLASYTLWCALVNIGSDVWNIPID